MAFHEELEGICARTEGAFAASVMGFDGLPIDSVEPKSVPGVDVPSLLAEYASLLGQVRQAADALQMGEASEVSIRTVRMVAIARMLTPEYFAVIALSPDGNVGRARYELRIAGAKMVALL